VTSRSSGSLGLEDSPNGVLPTALATGRLNG
jgi:hypothetical protein